MCARAQVSVSCCSRPRSSLRSRESCRARRAATRLYMLHSCSARPRRIATRTRGGVDGRRRASWPWTRAVRGTRGDSADSPRSVPCCGDTDERYGDSAGARRRNARPQFCQFRRPDEPMHQPTTMHLQHGRVRERPEEPRASAEPAQPAVRRAAPRARRSGPGRESRDRVECTHGAPSPAGVCQQVLSAAHTFTNARQRDTDSPPLEHDENHARRHTTHGTRSATRNRTGTHTRLQCVPATLARTRSSTNVPSRLAACWRLSSPPRARRAGSAALPVRARASQGRSRSAPVSRARAQSRLEMSERKQLYPIWMELM